MATSSKLYYSAACDGCEAAFESDDHGVVLADTPEEVVELARDWEQWLVYRSQLLCTECAEPLAQSAHDYVVVPKTAPFCAICKQLPDASHPNVPILGQMAIGEVAS
jgi:hypothetical protein